MEEDPQPQIGMSVVFARSSQPDVAKNRLLRCAAWLRQQNNEDPKKATLQNKNVNDIQFILATNAERRNFLLSSADDDKTVPAGVDEREVKPRPVHVQRLRFEQFRCECEWKGCGWMIEDYDMFQRHVSEHITHIKIVEDHYQCMWDVCGHKTNIYSEIVRHINYHAYHAKLLAIGFNGRATLELERCERDSKNRNMLPPLKSDHVCMWTGCKETFNSMQLYLDHVRQHVNYVNASHLMCSWAGCGAVFTRRLFLSNHMRSHTGERFIACYHCGRHFVTNRKLVEHIKRQNADPSSGHSCTVCGLACATAYLLRDHTRKHISMYACTLCDMTATSLGSLATHVRYRHLGKEPECRPHPCPHCDYRAVTKWDLRKHIPTHTKKKKPPAKKKKIKTDEESLTSDSEKALSDEEATDEFPKKKPKVAKKYICHMCPESETKIFSRGASLTTHLVKLHGVQWPYGHSRFRYQISDDGMYRLTTTRYESLEVSKDILDGTSGPKPQNIANTFSFDLVKKSEATSKTPKVIAVAFREPSDDSEPVDDCEPVEVKPVISAGDVRLADANRADVKPVEIEMCDVDEHGNIIKLETIQSDVFYT